MALVGRDPAAFQVNLKSELADLWRQLRVYLLDKPAGFCTSIWVPSHAMVAETDPEREEKRQEKLQRAKAQRGWHEEWLVYNEHADKAAGRAKNRHPVPRTAVERIGRVDALARQSLKAAAQAVEDAALALPAGRGRRGRRG